MYLVMFAPEIVRLVFFRGAFNEHAVLLTSGALRGIAFGLWASTLGWILIRILNGAGRNFAAAIIIVTAYAINIVVNLLTSQLPALDGSGTLLLGIGEAVRGIVLLAGVMIALESRSRLMMLIGLACIPTALMALLGWQVHELVEGMIPRLMIGGVAYLVSISLALLLLMPGIYAAAFARARVWLQV
jgi:putative peptidoglycan lipid II flippase